MRDLSVGQGMTSVCDRPHSIGRRLAAYVADSYTPIMHGKNLRHMPTFESVLVGLLSFVIALAAVGAVFLIALQYTLQLSPTVAQTLVWVLPIPLLWVWIRLGRALIDFYVRSTGTASGPRS